jgi:hypothetical protein
VDKSFIPPQSFRTWRLFVIPLLRWNFINETFYVAVDVLLEVTRLDELAANVAGTSDEAE